MGVDGAVGGVKGRGKRAPKGVGSGDGRDGRVDGSGISSSVGRKLCFISGDDSSGGGGVFDLKSFERVRVLDLERLFRFVGVGGGEKDCPFGGSSLFVSSGGSWPSTYP